MSILPISSKLDILFISSMKRYNAKITIYNLPFTCHLFSRVGLPEFMKVKEICQRLIQTSLFLQPKLHRQKIRNVDHLKRFLLHCRIR